MAIDTQAATGAQPTQLRRARRVSTPRAVLSVAVLGTFMAFVDATIVNIAVPNIAHDFAKPLSSVSWVLNAYNIVFAAFLVGGGQLADLLGRRRVFSLAIVIFTLASGLCAIAPSLGLLVAARVLQAAGASVLVPSSLAIVLEAHEERERTHAVALWSAVAALAAGIGPPLGGLLITASSWRLVFLVNIPVGIAAFFLARRVIVESRAPGRRRVPDLLGALVLSAAIALLVLGIVKGQEWGWANGRTIGVLAGAIALGAYSLLRASRRRVPVIDLSLLRVRAFALSNGVTIVMASGFYAYTLCNVLFLTSVWRYSILTAGLALTPGPFTAIVVAGPASRLVERFGHRVVIVPGALVWTGGMAYFSTQLGIRPDFLGEWLPGMLILGLGAGLTFPTLSGAAVRSVPGPRFAVATSLNSVARQLGAALGVAVLVAILGTPSPLQALHAFEHGWQFAGACFLAGALACTALRVTRSREQAEAEFLSGHSAAAEPTSQEPALPELPSLADSTDKPDAVAPQTLTEFLRGVPLFAELEPELLERVAALAEQVRLARGEWLFRAGEDPDAVYAVRLGHLEVLGEKAGSDSGPLTLNTLTRGAVIGELALLNGSRRSASVRALRDSELVRIARPAFERLLQAEPRLALGLTRALSTQLQASRAIVPERQDTLPVTIALYALDSPLPLLDLAEKLSRELCAHGSVAVLYRPDGAASNAHGAASAADGDEQNTTGRYAPLVERCEHEHERVLMVCDGTDLDSEWTRFCLSRADRVVAIASAGPQSSGNHSLPALPVAQTGERLRGADLLLYGADTSGDVCCDWAQTLAPRTTYAVATGPAERMEMARVARRLAGRAVGVGLSGGGARAFAHLGALDVLLDAGLRVDRVAGVSMGAFVGALLACGRDAAEIDACCYEEWVRRNPINDYTLPRSSLIKGQKAEAMLERTFGDTRIESLSRSFYCASVDLRGARLLIDREGPLADAVASSMALPLIAPPHRRNDSLRVDGSLLDNLPLEPMAAAGEGPVLAIDVKGGEERRTTPASASGDGASADGATPLAVRASRRLPALPETMARIALLSSANTGESARRYADLTISARVPGVGLLEFHQIDQARDVGRRAALAALENAPEWLISDLSVKAGAPRRTVVRV